jgi:hypothetical protein
MLGLVAVAIRDSGVGVNESELERIFEHFVSTKPQGLGMGLAISRSIVEAHGGRIWATGNDARGLTLHVELPWGKRLLSTNVVGHFGALAALLRLRLGCVTSRNLPDAQHESQQDTDGYGEARQIQETRTYVTLAPGLDGPG